MKEPVKVTPKMFQEQALKEPGKVQPLPGQETAPASEDAEMDRWVIN